VFPRVDLAGDERREPRVDDLEVEAQDRVLPVVEVAAPVAFRRGCTG